MDVQQADLILYVAAEKHNQISSEFILELDLDPEDNEILRFLENNKIDLVSSVWNEFNTNENLTLEQEYILVIKAKRGDSNALNTLMVCFYDFVKALARRRFFRSSLMYNGSYDIEDLIQEGVLAIKKAVNKFDIFMKKRFSTYAGHWIKLAFTEVIYGADQLSIPRNRKNELMRLNKAYEECVDRGIEPSIEELAKMINMQISYTRTLYSYLMYTRVCYLNELSKIDSNALDVKYLTNPCDMESEGYSNPEELIIEQVKREELMKVLNMLKPKDKEILFLRFGFETGVPVKIKELAEREGMSESKMRSNIEKSIAQIRDMIAQNIDLIKE